MNNQISAPKSVPRAQQLNAYIMDGTNPRDLFLIYVEFVLYWVRADIGAYGDAARSVPGSQEKKLLGQMTSLKKEMHQAFAQHRHSGNKEWFEAAFSDATSSRVNYLLDNDGRPIMSILDGFFFSYRKEYQSLKTYEKIASTNPNPDVQNLLRQAADFQRRHIAFLDGQLEGATTDPITKKQDLLDRIFGGQMQR
jgi:rubrerythrin